MATINDIKEQSTTETPLLLFECVLNSGAVERWSTHAAMVNGQQYAARVLRHDLFEMQSGGIDGIDAHERPAGRLAARLDHHVLVRHRN